MAQTTEPAGSIDPNLEWKRPHPVTILVEIGRAVRSVAVAILVVRGGFLDGSSLIELGLVAVPLAGALGRWYTTRYALGPDSVYHHYGLLWRKKQVLPRSNVQNVSTKAGVLARMASVVELQISDASATGDISLRYLTQAEADRLTALLRSSLANPDPSPTDPAPADPTLSGAVPTDPAPVDPVPGGSGDPGPAAAGSIGSDPLAAPAPVGEAVAREPLTEPTIRELARAEATTVATAGLLVAAAVMAIVAPVVLAIDLIPFPDDAGRLPLLIAAGAVAIPLVLVAIGIGSQLLTLGGYRLFAEPDRLRIQVGLLTEARITARRERIQLIRVESQLLHRRLGLERVGFETADLEAEGTAGTGFLAPIAPAGTWPDLATEVFGDVQLDESQLTSVSPLTTRRMFVRIVLASLPFLTLGFVHPLLPVPVIALLLTFGWWYARNRYRRLGWAISDDQYLVRTGVVNGRLTLVRLDKIQSLRLHATPFQRRLDLATVKVSTAGKGYGGLVTLPDLPVADADRLFDRLARRAARTPIADTL